MGAPGRRFATTPEIPAVRYAEIKMRSSAGLNYVFQVSNLQGATAFSQAVTDYGGHLRPRRPSHWVKLDYASGTERRRISGEEEQVLLQFGRSLANLRSPASVAASKRYSTFRGTHTQR